MIVRYLDFETICLINERFCGQGAGVRDRNGVRSVALRPQATWEGADLFPRVVDKAAAYLHGFATTQYFRDGNKRTSFLCATVFIEGNDLIFDGPTIDEAEAFLLSVAAKERSIADVALWLDRYSFGRRAWKRLQAWQDLEDYGHL
ncbi:Fic family protein [Microbacterium sp. 10M-3C3]|jgi:death-on-curing protein|uniref:type II toxin-antitoxin system death-on-curing family toxin n=1 Tax=Microbacterium sp. 10M-3C3 TaxID=2483401 RepID=UPI000F643DC0|nr:Fic family protein [Microbacterium sp. 10M-3C3]